MFLEWTNRELLIISNWQISELSFRWTYSNPGPFPCCMNKFILC